MKDVVRKAAAGLIGFCVEHRPGGRAFIRGHHMDVHIQRLLRARIPPHPDGRIHHPPAAERLLRRWRRTGHDAAAIQARRRRGWGVLTALGGPASVNLLLTGHSHFDHSFDTATWSRLSGARISGSKTTCLQAMAETISADRCTGGLRRRADVAGGRRDAAGGAVESQRRLCE